MTAAAEEMDTETPEEARWATGGPEEGGGEGLSLRDLLPHNALKETVLRLYRAWEGHEEEMTKWRRKNKEKIIMMIINEEEEEEEEIL